MWLLYAETAFDTLLAVFWVIFYGIFENRFKKYSLFVLGSRVRVSVSWPAKRYTASSGIDLLKIPKIKHQQL